VPQRLQGPKPFPIDRLLAIFAALYAENGPRPAHLLATPEDDYDSSSEGEQGEYLTIAEQAAKAEKKTKGDNIKDDIWDEEVEHLTMSVKLWSLVRFRFPLSLSHTPFLVERLFS
jgi:origin recognition complex subunit 5